MLRFVPVVLAAVATAHAQQADPAWQRLSNLREGASLQIQLRNRDFTSDRLVRWTPDELVLKKATVPRADIVKVGRRSRLRGALYGFLGGFAVGFPIGAGKAGYFADRNNPSIGDRLGFGSGFGLFFGGIGAGLGAAIGAHPTVYRAP
jgi:hypothetical protein